jgi:L-iditol 2-dehydrogenase
MKSVQFTGIRQLEIMDVPQPQIKKPDDVLLKIAAVGVCGSDIHYYADGKIGDQILQYPFAAGHETAAIVEKVGPGVKELKPGDRVAVEPAVSCESCDQCKSGRENTCRNLLFLGCPCELAGCLCEFIVMPERNCFKIPDSLTMAQAAFAEPLSIAIYTLKYLENKNVKTCAVLGTGPIGLSVLLEAKFQGIKGLYATDKINSRLDVAKKAGAIWGGNPEKIDVVSEIQKMEPNQLDCVIECCGQQEAIDQAIELLKPGGLLVIVGIPIETRVSVDMSAIRRKEICIQPVRRQNGCLDVAVDRIASGQMNIDFLVTHTGGLADSKQIYDKVANYKDGVLKAMIEL